MGSYGRNLEFRVPPASHDRNGRFVSPTTGVQLVLGAPVIADYSAGFSTLGLQTVKYAPSGAAPTPGECGVLVYEYGPAAFAGFDPALTTYSDLSTAPLGKAVQVVSGPYVKICLTNTPPDEVFLGNRSYIGRTMVNGLGATPTVTAGDYLAPGLCDDTDGYWVSQSSATGAWMIITYVDPIRVQVECRMLF